MIRPLVRSPRLYSAGLSALGMILLLGACSPSAPSGSIRENGHSTAQLRALKDDERQSDFDSLIRGMKSYYGPLSYKEQRFGFKFDELAAEYRDKATKASTDEEFVGVVKQFLARFHDGHISIEQLAERDEQFMVPILLTPVEGRAIIATVDDVVSKEMNIERGDEVVEIDGKPTMSYLPIILKYESFATDLSNQHYIVRALLRPKYITDLRPTQPTVTLKIAKASGETIQRTLVWKEKKNDSYVDRDFPLKPAKSALFQSYTRDAMPFVNQGAIDAMGSDTPFYFSDRIQAGFGMVRVTPSESTLNRFGLKDMTKLPKIFAALYRYEGKSLLLLRQPSYSVPDTKDRIAYYKALLSDYGSVIDALVLDQTHNPGGDLSYAQDFLSIFASSSSVGLVNFLHADRAWLAHLSEEIAEIKKTSGEKSSVVDYAQLGYKLVESAYDQGLSLTETPVPLMGLDYLRPADYVFRKPILLLVDELSGSCGDIVPMLMKTNKLAKLFGERTMGLGGNVEPIVTLEQSQLRVHLTRGFFMPYSPDGAYDLSAPTENNGVVPDIHYSHTVNDFRTGYFTYVVSFSKAAAALAQ